LKNNRSGDPLKELIDSDPHLKSLFENITAPAARLNSRGWYCHCG